MNDKLRLINLFLIRLTLFPFTFVDKSIKELRNIVRRWAGLSPLESIRIVVVDDQGNVFDAETEQLCPEFDPKSVLQGLEEIKTGNTVTP